MSVTYDDKNRQVIPRCMEYSTACALDLLRVIRKQDKIQITGLEDSNARQDWLDRPSIAAAVDFVAEALILKEFESEEAIEAAKYILSKERAYSLLIRQLASHFIEPKRLKWEETFEFQSINESREDIARIKKSVRMHPVNPIAWSDLSLYYATLGQVNKSKNAMKVALKLGNNNRFILRSASRCFMHMGEPDRAVKLLNDSGICAIDPWIASAEIAIAERNGLKSRSINKAKNLVKNENFTPLSRSELAMSLGTAEMKYGSVKKAKKLMNQSLVEPTENALAQAEWMATQLKIDVYEMVQLRSIVPASYEATAVHLYYKKEFEQSLRAAEMWGRFQFLSSRPIIVSMFLSSTHLENDKKAIDIFNNALPAQRENVLVMNNYAFALARIGLINEAVDAMNKINISEVTDDDKITLTATSGLICFREGEYEIGRKLYDKAVKEFESIKNLRSAAMATYYWAAEEKRIKSENAEEKIKEAKRGIEKQKVFELEDLAKRL